MEQPDPRVHQRDPADHGPGDPEQAAHQNVLDGLSAAGRSVGDLALRTVAKLIRQTVREVDVLARFGGDEFLVILPSTHLAGSVAVAERVGPGVIVVPAATARDLERDVLQDNDFRQDDYFFYLTGFSF